MSKEEQIGRAIGMAVVGLGVFLLPYFMFAFIGMEPDPTQWGGVWRFFYVAVVIALAAGWWQLHRGR